MKQRMIIVVGPSGVGKSSFVDRAVQELPYLVDVITYTTRQMRPGESEGHPYHFVSQEEFSQLVENDFFVEWAHVHSNRYGTPRDQIVAAWDRGSGVIMDIDIQGARACINEFPQLLSIFIEPPSLEELRRRIEKRSEFLPKDFEIRMENAKKEIAAASEFDCRICNDDFAESFGEFKKIIEEYWQNG
ncbi:MAG: guanylate kinase [Bdellovibrionales bacterium]|nr:guanylate kinase [Bdellovibrionales bacterium]